MGSVEARDEAEAREKALKQLDIRPADQFRISISGSESMPFQLEPEGDHYVLTNGVGDKITLNTEEVLTLGQYAKRMRRHAFAKLQLGSVVAFPTEEAVGVRVNVDLHKTLLILEMADPDGGRTGFALPLHIAKPLADGLPKFVAELEAAQTSQRHQ
jgi:hypothetical protein